MSLADALVPNSLVPHTEEQLLQADPENETNIPQEADEELSEDAHDEDMQDLFGEDNIAEEIKHEEATTPASSEHFDGISSPERKHREAMEYAEDGDAEPVVEQVLEASATIPNIPVPSSSDGNYWVIRMPNFISVDSKPFHPDTYVDQEDEGAHNTESLREKSMSVKLKVENTVRWRWSKDQFGSDVSGSNQKQSNGRIIRWSDGSLSLKLGKELFDITQTIDTSASVTRQAIGPSNSQPQLSNSQSLSQPSLPKGQGQGLTYLVAQHKRAEILQCEALITGYMSLRPTGMQSETHRMLVRAVGQKHNKIARLRMAPDPTMDPEKEKQELLKLASKKPKKARGAVGYGDDGFGGGSSRRRRSGGGGHTRKRAADDMWSDEEDEDGFGEGIGGASDEEFGGDDRKAKRRRDEEEPSSKKGPGEYQTDDFLVSDSEEDAADSDAGGVARRSKKKRRDDEAEMDDLEKLEAKLEEAEKREKSQVGDEDAMEVESEEEEEEYSVRKAGTASGTRRKRAVEADDEDEDEE